MRRHRVNAGRRLRQRVSLVVGVLLPLVILTTATGRSSAAPAPLLSWLALGDSFSAGEGIPGTTRQRDIDGKECARANGEAGPGSPSNAKAWAVVAFDHVRDSLFEQQQFVACTGAINDDISHQIEEAAVSGRTSWDLVTFSSGGNNIKFSDIITGCLDVNNKWDLFDLTPGCDVTADLAAKRIKMLTGALAVDKEQYNGSIALPALYDEVAKSVRPGGLVIVAGYPQVLEETNRWNYWQRAVGSCQGILGKDVSMLRQIGTQLNAAIRDQVEQADSRWISKGVRFEYADFASGVYETDGGRHGLCSGEQWLNGITVGVTSGDIRKDRSFHPTQNGHTASGDYVARLVEAFDWPAQNGSHAGPATGDGVASTPLVATNGLPARAYFGRLSDVLAALDGTLTFNVPTSVRQTEGNACALTVVFEDVVGSSAVVFAQGFDYTAEQWSALESAPPQLVSLDGGRIHHQIIRPPVSAGVGTIWNGGGLLVVDDAEQVRSSSYALEKTGATTWTFDGTAVTCS